MREDNYIKNRFKMVAKSRTFNNIIGDYKLDHSKVLDIGCSSGEYLCKFGAGSVGLTVNQDEVEYGKSRGLDIRMGNLEESYDLSEKFQVIFANNIFEHLYSPHHFLQKIKSKLGDQGVLILGVPCIPTLTYLLRFRRFRGSLATAHINFFTKITLIKTVEMAGWSLIDVRGYHFKNKLLDRVLHFINPHFYIVAKVDKSFKYDEKRLKELDGYKEKYSNES